MAGRRRPGPDPARGAHGDGAGRGALPILNGLEVFERWADTAPPETWKICRAPSAQIESTLAGPAARALRRQLRTVGSCSGCSTTTGPSTPAARKPVDEAVAGTGWEAVLAHEPRHRLAKRGFKLDPGDRQGG